MKVNFFRANVVELPEPEYTVKNLVEGKEYEFRVCAVNAAGPGKFSDGSGGIKAAPPPGENQQFWNDTQNQELWNYTKNEPE